MTYRIVEFEDGHFEVQKWCEPQLADNHWEFISYHGDEESARIAIYRLKQADKSTTIKRIIEG